MGALNLRNAPVAAAYGLAAASLTACSVALWWSASERVADIAYTSPVYRSYGMAVAFLACAAVVFLLGLGKLFERHWGDIEAPTLTAEDYLVALAAAEAPSWTCTRCRVLKPGAGIGSCLFCDSGAHCYRIDSVDDLKMILASMD